MPNNCTCPACSALLAECGPDLFPLYSKKLLIHGWAGAMSQAERAYRRAHSRAAQQSAARLRDRRGSVSGPSTANGASPVGVSAQNGDV